MKRAVEIRAEAVVAADADALWSMLARHAWPWSRLMAGLGPREPGRASVLRLRAGPWSVPIPVKVLVVEPCREIRWRGGIPGVFEGEHYFRFHRQANGTRVEHGERFSGVIGAPLIALLRRRMTTVYSQEITLLAAACAGDGPRSPKGS